jgi:hypothetical protein
MTPLLIIVEFIIHLVTFFIFLFIYLDYKIIFLGKSHTKKFLNLNLFSNRNILFKKQIFYSSILSLSIIRNYFNQLNYFQVLINGIFKAFLEYHLKITLF